MEPIIVITESRLIELIENTISKCLIPATTETKKSKHEPYWSSSNHFDLVEAAEYLGVSKGHISNLINKNQIPSEKALGRVRLNKNDLDKFIQSGTVKRHSKEDKTNSTETLAKSANWGQKPTNN
jgi:excisionase family DNA binding protein